MRVHVLLAAVAVFWASTAVAQKSGPIEVWLQKDIHLEISSEIAGPRGTRKLSGGVSVNGNLVRRFLADRGEELRFGYEIEVTRLNTSGSFQLLLKPLSPEVQQELAQKKGLEGELPTLSATSRVLLRYGDTTKIELMRNAETGEHVYDVIDLLRETRDEGAARGSLDGTSNTTRGFNFAELKIFVNGAPVEDNRALGGVSGKYVLVYLPGRGAFVFAREKPARYPFRSAGHIDRNRMIIRWEGDLIEFLSRDPIIESGSREDVWVYHDLSFKPGSLGPVRWRGRPREDSKEPAPDGFLLAAGPLSFLLQGQ